MVEPILFMINNTTPTTIPSVISLTWVWGDPSVCSLILVSTTTRKVVDSKRPTQKLLEKPFTVKIFEYGKRTIAAKHKVNIRGEYVTSYNTNVHSSPYQHYKL